MITNEVQSTLSAESQPVEIAPTQSETLENPVIEVVPGEIHQRKTLIPDELLPRIFPADKACQSNDY